MIKVTVYITILILSLCFFCVTDRLQASGKCERAAAVALFNNKIRQAIEILSSQQNHKDLGSKGK